MEPELLRFTTAGSIDGGKSTLIGRGEAQEFGFHGLEVSLALSQLH